MKKKLLSFALCLTMVATSFTAFPVTTNAAETETVPQDVVATEEQTVLPEEQNVVPEEAITDTGVLPEIEEEPIIENENVNMVPEEGTVDNTADQNVVEKPQVEPADKVVDQDKTQAAKLDGQDNFSDASMFETVNFTDPGPFMDPVDVTDHGIMTPLLRMFKASPKAVTDVDTNNNGLFTNKTVVPEGDGYKITLESYTKGEVKTAEKNVPVDIVLVLDQSGSMNFNFKGEKDGSKERQKAMIGAVNKFIGSVAAKYDKNASDHRISIVEFRGSSRDDSTILQRWTYADAQGKKNLQQIVTNLEAEGATNTAAGVQNAEVLMGKDYKYEGSNTERQKVVIVFTDGMPTETNKFDQTVADNAIKSANRLKAPQTTDNPQGGCTVYSVGIFTGADPKQLYGGKTDVPGKKSKWTGDIPAGNRFLNYLSSNSSDASSLGLKQIDAEDEKWQISKNYTLDKTGYYLTADNAVDLNNIFQKISENIESSKINLGPDAVLRDVVTKPFDMPANASDIKVYTSDYNGTGFGQRVEAPDLTVKMNGKQVEVSGFDYNNNFVSDTAKADETFGKKLIVEFTVTPNEAFLGGNQVPTNEITSGVFKNDTDSKALDEFVVPTVNVPVKELTVTAPDKDVYLHADASNETLKNDVKVTFGGKTFTELADWQKAYVNEPVVSVAGGVEKAEQDGTYTAEVKLDPLYPNSARDDMKPVPGTVSSATGNIYVYKPEITFKDLRGYYGDAMPNNLIANAMVGDTKWVHEGIEADSTKMIGTAPDVTYAPDVNNTYIGTRKDIPVNVIATIRGTDITNNVIFEHQDCEPKCGFDPKKEEFLVHVKTCTLIVHKNVTNGDAGKQLFVMDVTGQTNIGEQNVQVTVAPNGSTVIKGLPTGTYTVKEDLENNKWAWRYEVTYSPNNASATLTSTNLEGTVTVTNNKTTDKWLNAFAAAENMFADINESNGTVSRLPNNK